MNFIGLLYDCEQSQVRGKSVPIKYLTAGLEHGVRVVEYTPEAVPSGWEYCRVFGMDYFLGGGGAALDLQQRFLGVLLGSSTEAGSLLKWLHSVKCKLADLGIHSPALQNIPYERLTAIGKAAWLPDTGLTRQGSIPVTVSCFVRGSGTLAEETEAVLPLRDGNTALVAQAEGFAMLNAFDENEPGYPEQFRKQLHLFGLYKAYERALQQATRRVVGVLDEKNDRRNTACARLVELQESLAEFDARYYFESPVESSRHELTKCTALFDRMSTARSQHNDVVNQIERLGHLARAEVHEREERQHKKRDRKLQWISVLFTVVAVIIAAGQLLGQSPEQWMEVLRQWGEVLEID